MPNPIENIQAFLAANPTAKVWVDERVVRGGPGAGPGWGVVRGAHFTLGVESVDPTGQVTRTVYGPYPARLAIEVVQDDAVAAAAPMAQVLGVESIMQQATIDALTATVAARDQTVQEQAAALAARQATIDQQAARIAQLEAAP